MDIGFTGNQLGMTNHQYSTVYEMLSDLEGKARHGMCVGADKQFHDICRKLGFYIIGHPGVTKTGKAWNRADCDVDEIEPELSYLDRNTVIAQSCEYLIATPKEFEEELRSGTWSTIRRARRFDKDLSIVYPDGTVSSEFKWR